MKAFYGLILETQKDERTYQFHAPIGVQFDEVISILEVFKGMLEEMAAKAKEQEESKKEIQDASDVVVDAIKEDDGITS